MPVIGGQPGLTKSHIGIYMPKSYFFGSFWVGKNKQALARRFTRRCLADNRASDTTLIRSPEPLLTTSKHWKHSPTVKNLNSDELELVYWWRRAKSNRRYKN
jgi:hypothetical protein